MIQERENRALTRADLHLRRDFNRSRQRDDIVREESRITIDDDRKRESLSLARARIENATVSFDD